MRLLRKDVVIVTVVLLSLTGFLASPAAGTVGIAALTTPTVTTSTTFTPTTSTTISTTSTTTSSSTSTTATSTTTSTTSTSTSWSYTSTYSTTTTNTTTFTSFTKTGTAYQTTTSTTTTTSSSATTRLVGGTTTVAPGLGGNCPVAFATTGTPLEPYANFLRGFRNNEVMNTTAGRGFMVAFNSWYYSWAPSVSYEAASNPAILGLLRVGVYPLIGILFASYFSYVLVSPLGVEAGALTAGVVAASLIGLVYVAPLAYVATRLIQRRLRFNARGIYSLPAFGWVSASAVMIAAAYLAGSAWLMGLGTASLTLSMLATGTLLGAKAWTFVQLPLVNLHSIVFTAKRVNR